jgi:hypothetical protein
LQPAGLAVPDVYFFNRFLVQHIKNSAEGESWFEQAFISGLITPWVRSADITDFRELRALFKKSNLIGHYDEEPADEIAGRLSRLQPKDLQWREWPAQMGVSFDRLVSAHLAREIKDIPIVEGIDPREDLLAGFLIRSTKLRYNDVDAARQMCDPKDGLRLGNIVRATGSRLLGEQTNKTTIMNVEDLLARLRANNKKKSLIRDVKTFFAILTHLYNLNQSEQFDTNCSFPQYSSLTELFVSKPASVTLGGEDLLSDDGDDSPTEMMIRLPSPYLLKKIRLSYILEKRKDCDRYQDYVKAFSAWTANASDLPARRDDLLDKLRRYAEYICNMVCGPQEGIAYQAGVRPKSFLVKGLPPLAGALTGGAAAALPGHRTSESLGKVRHHGLIHF